MDKQQFKLYIEDIVVSLKLGLPTQHAFQSRHLALATYLQDMLQWMEQVPVERRTFGGWLHTSTVAKTKYHPAESMVLTDLFVRLCVASKDGFRDLYPVIVNHRVSCSLIASFSAPVDASVELKEISHA